MQNLTIIFAFFLVVISLSVLVANPQRPSNRAFGLLAALLAVWLVCVFGAMVTGTLHANRRLLGLGFWLRANAFVSSFAPWGVLLLRDAIIFPELGFRKTLLKSVFYLGAALIMAALALSESFVFSGPGSTLLRGSVYYIHSAISLLLYSIIIFRIIQKLRMFSGIRRLELQYFALSNGLGLFLITVLNVLGNYWHLRTLNRAGIVVLFASCLFMAWALAHHRIFNARDMLASLGHRLAVVGALAAAAWALSVPLAQIIPEAAAWITCIFVCALAIFWLEERTKGWFGLDQARLLAGIRNDVIGVSRRQSGSDNLVAEFEHLIARRFGASFAVLLTQEADRYAGRGIEIPISRIGLIALRECAWITPESLQRRRSTPMLEDLAVVMREYSLGVIVAIPRGNPAPSMLVAAGTKSNEWPFTYPEVEQLQNVGELMDNILIRSRLTDQEVLRAKMEHLALMSRGLAHDLKNLITPVSSFLVHTEGHYQAGSAEAEVHSQARRSIRIVAEYLREALFFSDRLQPAFEVIDLDGIFSRVGAACATRASSRGVTIVTEQRYPGTVIADSVLLQRLLSNLVANAIDASESGQKVRLAAGRAQSGRLQLQVIDSGCGIPSELVDRIFEPYFTTKQFGDDMRGFGLGLPISQRIVHLHSGTISVRSSPGKGTEVTVEIPPDPITPQSSHASAVGASLDCLTTVPEPVQ